MGFVSAGADFASYNIGDEYTTGVQANIRNVADRRVVTYSVTSPGAKIYSDGTGKLIEGRCYIKFDDTFATLISREKKPTVVVTPLGICEGLFIEEIDGNGFSVRELNKGDNNVEFTWIAIGYEKGFGEDKPIPESVARTNFDANMLRVMEPVGSSSTLPLWFDGTRVRFDNHPVVPAGTPATIQATMDDKLPSESIIKESLIHYNTEGRLIVPDYDSILLCPLNDKGEREPIGNEAIDIFDK